jgi:PAS domain S-box-containing protein
MRKWISIGFVGVLVLLVVNVIVAYSNTSRLVTNERLVSHTHLVQRHIEGLLSDLKDMETGQRGYLLTGDEAYLAPHDAASQRVPQLLARLKELTAGNEFQQDQLRSMEGLIAARIATLAGVIATRRAQGFEAARDQLLSGPGKEEMGRIRQLGAALMHEEDRLHTIRRQQSRGSARQLLWVFAMATLLAIGAVIGLHGLYRRDQRERQQADERFRLAVESAPSAMIMVNSAGQMVLINSLAESLFGYDRSELLFADVEVLVPQRVRASHPAYRQQYFAAPAARPMGMGRDLFARRKDGSEFPVEIGLNPIHTRHGVYVLAAIVNIAERKHIEVLTRRMNEELEERVIRRTADLEAANKELEAFSYTISHDLRAPLRAIDGFSRILLEDFAPQLPAECQEYLQDVRAGTQQMGRLTDDLLEFSRLSRQPLQMQAVSMRDIVETVLGDLRNESEPRQIELVVGELPVCRCDPALIKQVWFNLIANALKYTSKRPEARIEIGAGQADTGRHTFFVKDNGVGFDMRYANKLFGVFQRLHRAEEFAGTGVGLAIVQRIVHRHGGQVWAEAKPQEGATFFFTLPE